LPSRGCRDLWRRWLPLSWEEMKFILAISYAQTIQAFVDQGEEALRSEVKRWEPEARVAVAQALAEGA
jgi:hypothetical protein